jgi:hypothetical protein
MRERYGIDRIPLGVFIKLAMSDAAERDKFPFNGKLLFEHMPKCGGTSIKSILAPHMQGTYFYSKQQKYHYNNEQFIFGHDLYTAPCYSDKQFLITTLRNPIHRIASLYNHIKGMTQHPDYKACNSIPLEQCSLISNEFNNQMTAVYSQQGYKGLTSDSVKIALENLKKSDLVGSVKGLPRFIDQLAALTNLPLKMQHRNKGSWDIKAISNEAVMHIAEHNQLDLKLWELARHEFNLD